MKYVVLIFLTFLISFANASNDFERQYIENYIKQMVPLMIANIANKFLNISQENAEKLANDLVPKMARCQYASVSHYPKKYWEPYIASVATGARLQEAASIVDDLVEEDVEKGHATEEEIVAMVEKAQKYLQLCIKS